MDIKIKNSTLNALDVYTKRLKNGLYDEIIDFQNDVTEYLEIAINRN